MVNVELKGCIRCGGDIIHDWYTADDHESYCIQCAYRPPTKVVEVEPRYAKFEELRRFHQAKDGNISMNG